MYRKLKSKLRRLMWGLRFLSPYSALRLGILNLFGIRRSLNVRVAGVKLAIRSGSTDFEVAVSSLGMGEYDGLPVSSADVIIDAGANIGTSAVAFSRLFPTAKIICIEPECDNAHLLRQNTRALENVVVVEAALTLLAVYLIEERVRGYLRLQRVHTQRV